MIVPCALVEILITFAAENTDAYLRNLDNGYVTPDDGVSVKLPPGTRDGGASVDPSVLSEDTDFIPGGRLGPDLSGRLLGAL